MSAEIPVSFSTRRYEGTMHQPGVGNTHLALEVVTGIQLPDSTPLRFANYLLPGQGSGMKQLHLPQEKAIRLGRFSQVHFVDGQGNFDCRSFLGYVMEWDEHEKVGSSKIYRGRKVNPSDTRAGLPYGVVTPVNNITHHVLIGGEEPGEGVSVAGFEYPLVFANNTQIVKAFGGSGLLEVESVEENSPLV